MGSRAAKAESCRKAANVPESASYLRLQRARQRRAYASRAKYCRRYQRGSFRMVARQFSRKVRPLPWKLRGKNLNREKILPIKNDKNARINTACDFSIFQFTIFSNFQSFRFFLVKLLNYIPYSSIISFCAISPLFKIYIK